MKKIILFILVILISGGLFSACLPNSSDTQNEGVQIQEPVQEESLESDSDVLGESDDLEDELVTIEMDNYSYSVDEIKASPGETITINLVNLEGNHDLVIDELDYHSPHLYGEDSTQIKITIPEDASGTTYEYYCSVGSHREMGMVGTIIVE